MPVPADRATTPARRLGAALEPVVGQVYFSPECHAGYAALGLQPQPGQGRPGRAARRAGLLHQPRLGDGPGARRARGRGVRRVQPGRRRASRLLRLDPHRRGHDLRRPRRRRHRAAPPHPRRRPARPGPGLDAARAGRPSRSRRGPAALRRRSARSASPTTRSGGCGGPATCSASAGATPTSSPGWTPASRRWRSACSPSCSGACRCAPTSGPGPGARTSSTPARRASAAAACWTATASAPRAETLRERIEAATDAMMQPAIDALGDDLDELRGDARCVERRPSAPRAATSAGAGDLARAAPAD